MAELPLSPASAFGPAPRLHESWPGFSIRADIDQALASVAAGAGRLDDLNERARAGLGVTLPPPGQSTTGRNLRMLWTGHRQWLVQTRGDQIENLSNFLQDMFGDTAAITDQSDAWVAANLEGPRMRAVLERLCPLDLHADQFPPGRTARTAFAHLAVIITSHGEGDRFALLFARSSARSFLSQLRQAADSEQATPAG